MEDKTQQLRAHIAALEASQTRYQGELAIQHANFGRQIAELKARLKAFDV